MWAQDSLWACVGIFLVSGLMKLGSENLYLNIYIYMGGNSSNSYIGPQTLFTNKNASEEE